MQWYYAINGQRQGPVIETEFERLVRDGIIRPETLVWRQGMPEWVAYSLVGSPSSGAAGGVPVALGAAVDEDSAICAASGKRYPKREMIQYEGKWVSAEHRDAFFQRMREGATPLSELRFAGFWIRVVAKIIDMIALLMIGAVIDLLLGNSFFAQPTITPDQFPQIFAKIAVALIVKMAVALLYDWFFLARFQATPGKLALGLKVVRSDGSALGTGRIIGRHFAEMLNAFTIGIGYIIVAFDDEKRSLHDHICDTRVIKAR